MKTSVVILNWNTSEFLERFIPGILRSLKGLDAELVVVDNGSEDSSAETMARRFPDVKTIRLDRNYGFTGGYDKALPALDSEYFLLLNSDIEVTEGWLQPLVETLDRNPDVGACAPKLHSWQERNRFEYAGAAGGYVDCFGFPFCRGRVMKMTETDEGQYDAPADVMWATGACLLVRSSLFTKLGGLDNRFFAHMEEIDLCWRIQLEGFRVRIVPQSVVYHLGGGTLPQTSPWKLKLNYRNNLLLLENNLAKTLALQMLKCRTGKVRNVDEGPIGKTSSGCGRRNDAALKEIAALACRKARMRIFLRMVVDGCTGIAYLIQFRPKYFLAVLDAHSEFRKLSRGVHAHDVAEYLSAHGDAEVRGIYGRCMIPRAIWMKEKFFSQVREYFRD